MTKVYKVTYVCPFTNKIVTNPEVDEDSLSQNDSGELVYSYNKFHPECEVISTTVVDPSYLASKLAYFEKWGTGGGADG